MPAGTMGPDTHGVDGTSSAFTVTDAVSFGVVRTKKVTAAFTFDRHFAVAGFEIVPGA